MQNQEDHISHYLVCIYTHHEHDELITPFLDSVLPGNYASQFPIITDEGFNICYEVYCSSKEMWKTTEKDMLQFLSQHLNKTQYKLSLSTVQASDWQNEWKRFFKPILIGQRLVVAPSWENQVYPSDIAVVLLDPGMAFGTGNHGTTKGCLFFLEKIINSGESVFDVGTGSGVLAIAAVKLGAASVIAIDNDPLAISVSKENSQVNQCEDKIMFKVGSLEVIDSQNFDTIVANLTVAIHLELLDPLRKKYQYKHLILSGISDFSKPELDAFLSDRHITPVDTYHEGDWNTYLID
ncbi:MAG: hypothetical protein A2Y40_09655 [Candidatus Margulisbacteria bacterium GWF2_35_9]|nr:MAG: hypothetical protein A2Y40_09655 [Candidatus Margulisbacteria bacterium GWF2_35_9]